MSESIIVPLYWSNAYISEWEDGELHITFISALDNKGVDNVTLTPKDVEKLHAALGRRLEEKKYRHESS